MLTLETHRAETPGLSQKLLSNLEPDLWHQDNGENSAEEDVRSQKLFQSREQVFPAGLCLHVL